MFACYLIEIDTAYDDEDDDDDYDPYHFEASLGSLSNILSPAPEGALACLSRIKTDAQLPRTLLVDRIIQRLVPPQESISRDITQRRGSSMASMRRQSALFERRRRTVLRAGLHNKVAMASPSDPTIILTSAPPSSSPSPSSFSSPPPTPITTTTYFSDASSIASSVLGGNKTIASGISALTSSPFGRSVSSLEDDPSIHSTHIRRPPTIAATTTNNNNNNNNNNHDMNDLPVLGKGGSGKTVLAALLATDQRVRTYFEGGIAWLDIGKYDNCQISCRKHPYSSSGDNTNNNNNNNNNNNGTTSSRHHPLTPRPTTTSSNNNTSSSSPTTSTSTGMTYEFYRSCLISLCHQWGIHPIPSFDYRVFIPKNDEKSRQRREYTLMKKAKDIMIEVMLERNRNTLIVLDDVWVDEDIEWFHFHGAVMMMGLGGAGAGTGGNVGHGSGGGGGGGSDRMGLFGGGGGGPNSMMMGGTGRGSGSGSATAAAGQTKESCILVTTRVPNLRRGSNASVFSVDGLRDDEALSLLMTESGHPPNHLLKASDQALAIIRACRDNHALSIKTVGRWIRMEESNVGAIRSIEDVASALGYNPLEEEEDDDNDDEDEDRQDTLVDPNATPKLPFFEVITRAFTSVTAIEGGSLHDWMLCLASFVTVFCRQVNEKAVVPMNMVQLLWKEVLIHHRQRQQGQHRNNSNSKKKSGNRMNRQDDEEHYHVDDDDDDDDDDGNTNEWSDAATTTSAYERQIKSDPGTVVHAIAEHLVALGVFNVTYEELWSDGAADKLLQLNHALHRDYGEHILQTSMAKQQQQQQQQQHHHHYHGLNIPSDYERYWNDLFITKLLQRFDNSRKRWNDDRPDTLIRYGIHHVLSHALHAERIDDARSLICTEDLIDGRLKLLGPREGTCRHLWDCADFLQKASELRLDEDEFYTDDAIVLAHDRVGSCLKCWANNNHHAISSSSSSAYASSSLPSSSPSKMSMDLAKACHLLGVSLAEQQPRAGLSDLTVLQFQEAIRHAKNAAADETSDVAIISAEHANKNVTVAGIVNARNVNNHHHHNHHYHNQEPENYHDRRQKEFVAAMQYNIAAIFLERAELPPALKAAKESLKIRSELGQEVDDDNDRVAETLKLLSDIYFRMDEYDQSKKCIEEAVRLTKINIDECRLLYAALMQRKGSIEQKLNLFSEAVASFRESIRWRQKEVGTNDPELAESYDTLGGVQLQLDDKDDAIASFEESVRLKKLSPSKEPMVIADTMVSEAVVWRLKDDTTEALKCLKRVIRFRKSMTRDDVARCIKFCRRNGIDFDVRYALILSETAELHVLRQEYEQAARIFEQSLELRRKKLDEDDEDVVMTRYKLGCALAKFDYDRALRCLCEALSGIQEIYGEYSEEVASATHEIGMVLVAKKTFDRAVNWFKKEVDVRNTINGEDHDSTAAVLQELGAVHFRMANYADALTCYQEVHRIKDKKCGNDRDLEVADIMYTIAIVCEKLSEYDAAMKNLEEALRIRVGKLGYNSSLAAQTIDKIGKIHVMMGNYESAMQAFEEVLGLEFVSENGDSARYGIADTMYGKGCVYHDKGDFDEAMRCYEESLFWKKKTLGENFSDLAPIYDKMGYLHSEKGDDDSAIRCLEESIRLMELKVARNEEDEADILAGRGALLCILGEEDASIDSFTKGLNLYQRTLGGDHEKVASIKHKLACLYASSDRVEDAVELFEDSLRIRKKLFDSHLDVANTLYSMAFVYARSRELAKKAFDCLKEALQIRKQRLGQNSLVADTVNMVGNAAKDLRMFEEAMDYYQEALEIKRNIHGHEHETVALTLYEIGDLMNELQKPNEAVQWFNEALSIRTRVLGDEHPDVAATLHSMGIAYDFQKQYDQALSCFNEALRLRKMFFGDDHYSVGDTLDATGHVYLKQNEYEQALSCLWDALGIRKADQEDLKIAMTLQHVGNVHKAKGELDQAIGCLEECLRLRVQHLGSDDEMVGDAWLSMAMIRTATDNAAEAKHCFQEALRITTVKYGYEHVRVAEVLHSFGGASFKMGDHKGGCQYLEESVRILKKEGKTNNEQYGSALAVLGNQLSLMDGDMAKALEYWTEAKNVYENLGKEESDPMFANVMKRLEEAARKEPKNKTENWFFRQLEGLADELGA